MAEPQQVIVVMTPLGDRRFPGAYVRQDGSGVIHVWRRGVEWREVHGGGGGRMPSQEVAAFKDWLCWWETSEDVLATTTTGETERNG